MRPRGQQGKGTDALPASRTREEANLDFAAREQHLPQPKAPEQRPSPEDHESSGPVHPYSHRHPGVEPRSKPHTTSAPAPQAANPRHLWWHAADDLRDTRALTPILMGYLVLAEVVFGVNLLPAFAPPTLAVLVFSRAADAALA